MKLKILLLTFLLSVIAFPALADSLILGERQTYSSGAVYNPETVYLNGYYRGYCNHTYDRLFEGSIYQCQNVQQVWYAASAPTSTVSSNYFQYKDAWLRFNCWQLMHGVNYNVNNNLIKDPLILSQSYTYSTAIPSNYDFAKPCKLKPKSPEQPCNIDSISIIKTAFSQRFPLDLFIGIQGFSSPSTCPEFTVRSQTFKLCYLTKLTKSLKYVLLLVFIITSLTAL